jgi:thymidine kinase
MDADSRAAKLAAIADTVLEIRNNVTSAREDIVRLLDEALDGALEHERKSDGTIELLFGPMFSEKTSTMVARVRRAALAGNPAVIIKWHKDTRYEKGAVIASHGEIRQASARGTEDSAPIRVIVTNSLATAELDSDELVVGVDEGQFYPDLIEQCTAWALEGRRVIVAALDGDYTRKPFGRVCDLVPLCESVEKLRGVCMMCRRRESAFTRRFGGNTNIVVEGGKEIYKATCRSCYDQPLS